MSNSVYVIRCWRKYGVRQLPCPEGVDATVRQTLAITLSGSKVRLRTTEWFPTLKEAQDALYLARARAIQRLEHQLKALRSLQVQALHATPQPPPEECITVDKYIPRIPVRQVRLLRAMSALTAAKDSVRGADLFEAGKGAQRTHRVLNELIDLGYVERRARGRYALTLAGKRIAPSEMP